MNSFLLFAVLIAFVAAALVVWPIAAHPGLPNGRKLLLGSAISFLLMPCGVALYIWLGVPHLAGL